jgi:L-alanine-DL-glutamate epimerase-like enolase superfamily enzyme
VKIIDIKATPVAVPLKPSMTKSKMRKGPNVVLAVIVQVYTDDGYVGIGETPAVLGLDISTAIVNSTKALLIGEDPRNINLLIKKLYVRYNLTHLHIHLANWAFSGIELALWDIAAQSANMPLYQLWGGAFRKKIEMQGTIERQELSGMTEVASQMVKAGYKTLYTKIGMDPEDDVAAVAAIRKGASSRDVKIRVDANQAWSTGVAINTINKMEQYGIEWVEQPVIMYNIDALLDVKNSVNVPILGHEANWTMYDLINVIKSNAVDYVKLDGRFDAGYTGVRISAGMAEAAGIQCSHHSFYTLGIALAGSLHVIASCPNFSMANSMSEYAGMIDDVITDGPMRMKEVPYMEVPETPGIGVTIDKERLAKYNEFYVKEIFEKGFERETEMPYYTSMYMRTYFKDILN